MLAPLEDKLRNASRDGDIDTVVTLISNPLLNIQAVDDQGNHALHWACRRGFLEIAETLIEKGIHINHPNKGGSTALHLAIALEHDKVAMTLIQAGADVHVMNKNGSTALLLASSNGQLELVTQLLKQGAVIDKANLFGHTALSLASGKGHVEVVKKLLENGADIEIMSKDGKKAKDYAVELGHSKVAAILDKHVKMRQDNVLLDDQLESSLQNDNNTSPLDVSEGIEDADPLKENVETLEEPSDILTTETEDVMTKQEVCMDTKLTVPVLKAFVRDLNGFF